MRSVFPKEWRTQNRTKRRFYATYMRWVERIGYGVVLLVFAAFIVAFNYKVDDLVTADSVKIEPFAVSIDAHEPTLVIKMLASDFEEVQQGQPLMEVIQGEESIRRYLQEKWIDAGLHSSRNDTPRLKPRTILASAPGTLRMGQLKLDVPFDSGSQIARIVDYNDLRLTASLEGQTVSKAKVGQVARITSISSEPEAGVLFRGNGSAEPIISGRLLGEEVRTTLETGLKGKSVQLRDDVPLKISEVTEVQIDALTKTDREAANNPIPLDPPSSYSIQAQVVEGAPMATVQLADLPPTLAEEVAKQAYAALHKRSVQRIDGSLGSVSEVQNLRMLVKLKANEVESSGQTPLQGIMLSRSFDATLKVLTPPKSLIDLVRETDRVGKAVTARVELRTGTRPIALLLLRKS